MTQRHSDPADAVCGTLPLPQTLHAGGQFVLIAADACCAVIVVVVVVVWRLSLYLAD